ncbi:MAG: helix-turn-helix domain-containing protein [Mucilaginibacter sp.]|uniref:helix-turn-helix domain-containing protein n=1 Tax=Mucilaginibacter sp. TaxID=1882438 RepID=UPI0031B14BCE
MIMNLQGSFRAEKYQLSKIDNNLSPARRDFFKIWLVENSGTLEYGNCAVRIDSHALIFLHPLIAYRFIPSVENRAGYWCIFTAEFINHFTGSSTLHDSPVFDANNPLICFPEGEQLTTMRFLFDQIITEFASDYLYKNENIKSLINLLIHKGQKLQTVAAPRAQQNASTRLVTLFFNLLEKQYPITTPKAPLQMHKPAEFASALAVHTNHLNAVIQEVTGKSTSHHISERMISESKALLKYSDWPVADIAFSLGFDYPNHFTAFFKKHTGQTPLAFRK